jgi:hypothetical protein
MQVYIARALNRLLLLFSVVVVLLFSGIFAAVRFFPDYLRWHILIFIVVSIGLALFYRYLEENWDKNRVLAMAREGKVALMNITGGKRIMALRDTSFRNYWIYDLEGELYDDQHTVHTIRFQEKMNRETGEIPRGFVYVSYDPEKPKQIFIIPNALIENLPGLMELVQSYEKDRNIPIRYLDAHYNKGMVLKTFREAMADYKKTREPDKAEAKKK